MKHLWQIIKQIMKHLWNIIYKSMNNLWKIIETFMNNHWNIWEFSTTRAYSGQGPHLPSHAEGKVHPKASDATRNQHHCAVASEKDKAHPLSRTKDLHPKAHNESPLQRKCEDGTQSTICATSSRISSSSKMASAPQGFAFSWSKICCANVLR